MKDSKYIVLSAHSENHDFTILVLITDRIKDLIAKRMALASTLKSSDEYFRGVMYSFSDLFIYEDLPVSDDMISEQISFVEDLPEEEPVDDDFEFMMIVWPNSVSIRFWIGYEEETFETQCFDLGDLK